MNDRASDRPRVPFRPSTKLADRMKNYKDKVGAPYQKIIELALEMFLTDWESHSAAHRPRKKGRSG